MSSFEAFFLGVQFTLVVVAMLLDSEEPPNGDESRRYSRLRLRIAV